MELPQHEEVMWVRHRNDKGCWWPGVYVDAREESGMLVSALRRCDLRTALPETPSSFQKPNRLKAKVPLFCLPSNGGVLVAATQWRPYHQRPEGMPARFLADAKAQMDSIFIMASGGAVCQHVSQATTPATPSTVCGSAYSTVTPATPSEFAPSIWNTSPGCIASQGSPTSSTSSTGTQLDIPATQLDDITGNRCAETDWENIPAGAGSCSQSCGTKRQRAQTSSFRPSADRERVGLLEEKQHLEGDALAQAFPAALSNPRQKKECLERSQFPRLGSPPMPAAGPLSHRNRCDNGAGMRGKRCDTAGRMFDSVQHTDGQFGDQDISGHGTGSDRHLNRGAYGGSQQLDKVGAKGAGGPAQTEDYMDLCDEGSTAGDSVSTDRAESAEKGSANEDRGSSSSDDVSTIPPRGGIAGSGTFAGWLGCGDRGGGGGSHALPEAATLAPLHHNRSATMPEHVSADMAPSSAKEQEADALRAGGVTGQEEFKALFPKLSKLKWRWGRPVGPLSSDTWLLKPGANSRTAKAGVEKFEKKEEVVEYVREVLGVNDAATSDSEGEESEEEPRQGPGESFIQDELSESGEEGPTAEFEQGMPLTPEGQALQTALEALHPSKAPAVMNQREAQFKQVLRFIQKSVSKPSGGSLYLCGCPGTGKTQTMSHVQAEVQRIAAKGKFPAPDFHSFTGTAFTAPNAMHSALWGAVGGGAGVPHDIEKALRKKLTRYRSSPMVVVVVDEIDQLLSHNRQVLRKLFEWADAPKSRLVLLGIANSIEFDIGFADLNKTPAKVLFPAYTPGDLMEILTERVGNAVQQPAIQLCSKKVAAAYGDARKAISLCREAVVLAVRELQEGLNASDEERERLGQREGVPLVTIRHMSTALSAGRGSQYGDAVRAQSLQGQIVLCVAAAAVSGASGRGQGSPDRAKSGKCTRLTQGDLHGKCMVVWGRLHTGVLTQIEFSGIIDMLAAEGLVGVRANNKSGLARQLELLVGFSDVQAALGGKPFYKTAVDV